MTLKEYQATIDVCMGGRVAEEISSYSFSRCCKLLGADEDTLTVYGADGVTSGASSDLQKATQVATAMVKVCYCPDPEIN